MESLYFLLIFMVLEKIMQLCWVDISYVHNIAYPHLHRLSKHDSSNTG